MAVTFCLALQRANDLVADLLQEGGWASVVPWRRTASRFIKNSSRFEVKMARNFALSSSGVRSSSDWARTRSLKSSQLRSRSIQTGHQAGGQRCIQCAMVANRRQNRVAMWVFPR